MNHSLPEGGDLKFHLSSLPADTPSLFCDRGKKKLKIKKNGILSNSYTL